MKPETATQLRWRRIHETGDRNPPLVVHPQGRRPFWKPDHELKGLKR